jgi:amino acid adenylation domain-containing protein
MAYLDDGKTEWVPLVAAVLGLDAAVVRQRAAECTFTELGGTSLRAAEYIARLAQQSGREADMGALLGPHPVATAAPGRRAARRRAPRGHQTHRHHGVGRSQEGMLLAEQIWGCDPSPFHLLFSASISGNLDMALLRAALTRLSVRHPALRTLFTRDPETGSLRSRVLTDWDPVVIEQTLPHLPPHADPVDIAHTLLAPAAPRLLRPYETPPVVFIVTYAGAGQSVLSILAHHVILDGWSIGLLWRQIADEYTVLDARDGHELTAAGTGPGIDDNMALEQAAASRNNPADRAAALEGWPSVVEIPSDMDRPQTRSPVGCRLSFRLSEAAQAGCMDLAGAAGVTRNAALLAAWALVVGRRAGAQRLLIGMAAAGRPTAASQEAVGCCVKLLPVPCEIPAEGTVIAYVQHTGRNLLEAVKHSDVAFEDIVAAAGAGGSLSRNPMVQIAFGAHDELIPPTLTAGDLTLVIREGYCGGTAYDAMLYVQQWQPIPVLALEYATSVLTSAEAVSLASGLDRTLAEMAADPGGVLSNVTTMTSSQRQQLLEAGAGPSVDTSAGLWELITQIAGQRPDDIAVRDADPARTLTYRQLITATELQSAELAAAGVHEGDCVAIAVRRSPAEIIAILAAIRLGAAYTGLDASVPPAATAAMLDQVEAKAILGDPGRLAALGIACAGRTTVPIHRVRTASTPIHLPPAAASDPERIAYVAFTSGSTGPPKGTMVACRGVVRLARDPAYLRPGACSRFMRLAPLAFDASTLEIFAPLLQGGTIEIFNGSHATPDALAAFLQDRKITGLWLTAGLFRLAADYCPEAFRDVTQLLTGGDIVPPQQVAKVLRTCPGLRITNGYGPTENTTFTTAYHMDSEAAATAPLPIGRPIQGTGVLLLDHAGRLVPPGGVGELFAYGDGLAKGYAGMPAETADAFAPFSPEDGRVLYRTGDYARWDSRWNLRFLGRRDRQLKIRGFRVEPDFVAQVLREHPAVRDVVVTATPYDEQDRQILAAVRAAPDKTLPGILRSFAGERLPRYAVPSLWAITDEFPLTPNGKLDLTRLVKIATSSDRSTGQGAAHAPAAPETGDDGHELEKVVIRAWQEVLGRRDFGRHDTFFDAGGDSLQLLRLHATISRAIPHTPVTIGDLYAFPTIAGLAAQLRPRDTASATRTHEAASWRSRP